MNIQHIQGLVDRARDGDSTAIHELLVRYQPDVTRCARTVCATPEDAEDAVQEALWIASKRIGTLRVAKALTTWLFQVVKHECFRLFRQTRHEASFEDLPPPMLRAHLADQAALSHDVASAIAALEPHYRQVLIMRDVQEMTAPEVAATLGLSIDAVKSRLHRARTRVRVALHNWKDDEAAACVSQ